MVLDVQGFYRNYAPYIEEGLIKEIYADEYVSCMNFADRFYAVFNRTRSTKNNAYLGIVMSKECIEYIADYGFAGYKELVESSTPEQLSKRFAFCDERAVHILRELKNKGINHEVIDKEFEARMLERMAQRGSRGQRKQGIFGYIKSKFKKQD